MVVSLHFDTINRNCENKYLESSIYHCALTLYVYVDTFILVNEKNMDPEIQVSEVEKHRRMPQKYTGLLTTLMIT